MHVSTVAPLYYTLLTDIIESFERVQTNKRIIDNAQLIHYLIDNNCPSLAQTTYEMAKNNEL